LILFVITRTVWVRIIKEECFKLELHLPLLALKLSFPKEEKKKSKSKEKIDKISARAYLRIFGNTLERLRHSRVIIKRVILPLKLDDFSSMTLVTPFAYQGLIYAAIAYLRTKTEKLTILDNAIISSPDTKEIQFYLTVKLRLYQLIYALLTVKRGIDEEKRARRLKYVGE
jgi:hypothetical protein